MHTEQDSAYLFSGLLSSSTQSKPMTRCRKTCSSGYLAGFLVTSNNGSKRSNGQSKLEKATAPIVTVEVIHTANEVLEVFDET